MNIDKATDSLVRREARKAGFIVRKCRRHTFDSSNWGGYMLLDQATLGIIDGVGFDLTPEAVLDWCRASEN
jgi:hypothetical protein